MFVSEAERAKMENTANLLDALAAHCQYSGAA